MHQNAFAAGTPPKTPLQELTTLLQTSSWNLGEKNKEGEKGLERGRKRKGKGQESGAKGDEKG